MVRRPFSHGTFLATLALVGVTALIGRRHVSAVAPARLSRLVVPVVETPARLSCLSVEDHVAGVAQVSAACPHLVRFVQIVHAEPVGPAVCNRMR